MEMFVLDTEADATGERDRLCREIDRLETAGMYTEASKLQELDSDMFDVTDRAFPRVAWRSDEVTSPTCPTCEGPQGFHQAGCPDPFHLPDVQPEGKERTMDREHEGIETHNGLAPHRHVDGLAVYSTPVDERKMQGANWDAIREDREGRVMERYFVLGDETTHGYAIGDRDDSHYQSGIYRTYGVAKLSVDALNGTMSEELVGPHDYGLGLRKAIEFLLRDPDDAYRQELVQSALDALLADVRWVPCTVCGARDGERCDTERHHAAEEGREVDPDALDDVDNAAWEAYWFAGGPLPPGGES